MKFLISILVATCAVAASERFKRSYKGKDATLSDFPYIAQVLRKVDHFGAIVPSNAEPLCSGALIANDFVLTSAQCIPDDDEYIKHGKKAEQLIIVLNTTTQWTHTYPQTTTTPLTPVKETTYPNGEPYVPTPEEYSPTAVVCIAIKQYKHVNFHLDKGGVFDDIGLIKIVCQNPDAPKSLTKAKIATLDSSDHKSGIFVESAGFGQVASGQYPGNLQSVDFSTLNNAKCKDLFTGVFVTDTLGEKQLYFDLIEDSEICVVSRNQATACKGDWGGPLVARGGASNGEIVGVTSWGLNHECKENRLPSVFTYAPAYNDWIRITMEESRV